MSGIGSFHLFSSFKTDYMLSMGAELQIMKDKAFEDVQKLLRVMKGERIQNVSRVCMLRLWGRLNARVQNKEISENRRDRNSHKMGLWIDEDWRGLTQASAQLTLQCCAAVRASFYIPIGLAGSSKAQLTRFLAAGSPSTLSQMKKMRRHEKT